VAALAFSDANNAISDATAISNRREETTQDQPLTSCRAIARQAEAERERRAKIIHAEGEAAAAANLEKAAETMARQPGAIQLRYLQTLVEIGSEKNTTVVFPLPMDLLSSLGQVLKKLAGPEPGGSA
jgi:regulator of protease activity HflC (stomatin/prohibitin superfamily)